MEYKVAVLILKDQAQVLERYSYTHTINNFSEDLSVFFLNCSEPVTVTTKETPGFLKYWLKMFTSQAEEIQTKVKEHNQSIQKNSVVRQLEKQKHKQNKTEDMELGESMELEENTEAADDESKNSNHG